MKKLIALLTTQVFVIAMSLPAQAWTNPDQSGTCFFFSGNKLKSKTSCTISSGGGAGGMYTILKVRGKTYNFETETMSENHNTTYKGKRVQEYSRHAKSYAVLKNEAAVLSAANSNNLLYCYRTSDKKLDICYN